METGSSYFEGATVEREFEKKFKGQTNIYERLKCRPVLRTRRESDENSRLYNSSFKIKLNFWLMLYALSKYFNFEKYSIFLF